MPKGGFKVFVENLLNHSNIKIMLNTDALSLIEFNKDFLTINLENEKFSKKIIFTGPIDRLFSFKFGQLPYRSLVFDYKIINTDSFQPEAIVAYPQVDGFTRITEYSKLPIQKTNGKTVVAYEYPLQSTIDGKHDPYYPIPTDESKIQYNKYREEATKYSNLTLCGRLADFKYYNMDDTIENALNIFQSLNT
jgi:UDP-galactopyranose mutase